MNVLEISQIIFNFTATAVILVVGLMIGIIALEIIRSINRAKKMAQEIKAQSMEFYRRIDGFLATFAAMPFISKIFTKKKKNHE